VTNAERSFACDHTVPSMARTWTRATVLSMLPRVETTDDVVDDVEIVVSELVTNAVLASCAALHLALDVSAGRVHIEVSDDAAGWPIQQETSLTDAHGRGLAIVAALSSSWGVRERSAGKVVWAELELPPSLAKRLP
jgi:anti-sigma regulatory factor (Ser/Thr protein kinase)